MSGHFFSYTQDMVVREIQNILELWAPRELSWQGDNVGLQVGSPGWQVRKILITLDVSEQVIEEAKKKQVNLIISHHPLIFTPIKSLLPENRVGSLIFNLVSNNIALLCAHTNLDFTHQGVSFVLAEKLGIANLRVLIPQSDILKKIVVFIPSNHVDGVLSAMSDAGAGVVGNYDTCSFQSKGSGTFRGLVGSKPFIGKTGSLEIVEEVRLEMITSSWKLPSVIKAMKTTHPYEEVAYDVISLDNKADIFGAGAIGELQSPESLETFLARVQGALHAPSLRYTGKLKSRIKKVAVCGGSGSDAIPAAISSGADAFVTADLKYHTFQDAENLIALIDAGHFETESPVVEKLVTYLKEQIQSCSENIPVLASKKMSNPVHYFYS